MAPVTNVTLLISESAMRNSLPALDLHRRDYRSGAGVAVTLMPRLAVAVALGFAESVTVTVKLLSLAALGVPLISPVELFSDSQPGKSFINFVLWARRVRRRLLCVQRSARKESCLQT